MKRKSKKQAEEQSLGPHPLLYLPDIACGILTYIHERPEHLDNLKPTAIKIFEAHCTEKVKAIKPFKKKDGFDFAKEYKKWVTELKQLFDYYLNRDCPRDLWNKKARQLEQEDIPLNQNGFELWKQQVFQHIHDFTKVFSPESCRKHFERLSVEQVELHHKASEVYRLPPEWTYTKGIGVLAAGVLHTRKRRKTVEEVQAEAEAHVDKYGWMGFGKLQKIIGCAKGTLRQAIDNSMFLIEKEQKFKSKSPHKQTRRPKQTSPGSREVFKQFAQELIREGADQKALSFIEDAKSMAPRNRTMLARLCKDLLDKKTEARKLGDKRYTILDDTEQSRDLSLDQNDLADKIDSNTPHF